MMSVLESLAHAYLYIVAVMLGFVGGALFGTTQQRRYLFRRSCTRVTMLRKAADAGNPHGMVEVPGAEQLHRHVFSDAR